VSRIVGRTSELVRRPDGTVLTAPFLVFTGVRGVRWGRLVQTGEASVDVQLAPTPEFDDEARVMLMERLRSWLGARMHVNLLVGSESDFLGERGSKRSANGVATPASGRAN
jgi:hypothetical protein